MTQPERVVIISDLHMAVGGGIFNAGGALVRATRAAPETGRTGGGIFSAGAALVDFLKHLAASQGSLDLVILGDALDFLEVRLPADDDHPEAPYLDFSAAGACRKAAAIIKHNGSVFAALREFLRAPGKRVRWCVGNHDLELLFPGVQALLREALGGSADVLELPAVDLPAEGSRIDYRLANGKTMRLVHGNTGDPWNHIDYQAAASAVQGGAPFAYPPGSLLVAKVLNRLKDEAGFRHVSMLKPEKSVTLPLTLALWPERTRSYLMDVVPAFFQADLGQTKRRFKNALARVQGQAPLYFGPSGAPTAQCDDGDMLAEALLSSLADADRTAAAEDLVAVLSSEQTARRLGMGLDPQPATFDSFTQRVLSFLLRGVAESANQRSDLFHVDERDELHALVAARFAADAEKPDGVQVLVAGHTHLARAVSYDRDCYYLNSGTWADLMRIPRYLQGKRFTEVSRNLRGYFTDPASAPAELRPFQRLTYVDVDLGAAGTRPYHVALRVWHPDRAASLHEFP